MKNITIQRFLLVVLFVTLSVFNNSIFSEGTKQINPNPIHWLELWLTKIPSSGLVSPFGTYNVDSNHTIHVVIKHPGEKLYMGFNFSWCPGCYLNCRIKLNGTIVWGEETVLPIIGEPGFITSHGEAVIGPNVLDPGGYLPVVFDPQEPGDYIIEFDFPSLFYLGLHYFDFTVIDTTILPFTPINGRVWSKSWAFKSDATNGSGVNGTLYVNTADSLVDSITFNQMVGGAQFEYNFNRNGCFPPPTTFKSSRRSITTHNNYPEHQTFFNDPDSALFPSGTIGEIIPGSPLLIPDCNGQYYVIFQVNKAGLVQIRIEVDTLTGIQPEDVEIFDSVHQGIDTIMWNGINGLGMPFPITNPVTIIISFINGLVNLPIFQIWDNHNGFHVGLKRPPSVQPMQFWNDTLIPTGQMNLDGCLSTITSGCHEWLGNYPPPSGFGYYRTINTWWYSAIPDTIFDASLIVQVSTPDSIQGSDTICYDPNLTYSYSIFPNPLPGAQNFEWSLFQDLTLIQAWNTTIPSMNSVVFPDTGVFALVARGYNNCGYGDPDTIQILVFPPDTVNITISADTTEICDGESVTLIATPTNEGSTPVFKWKVDGINTGPNDPVFTYVPLNGDTITCVLTSSNTICTTNNPATSNSIIITVYQNLPVSISVSTQDNPVCEGNSATFTASTVNKGYLPVFQWFVNGIPVGTNDSVYSYIPVAGDQLYCILTSSELCTTNNPAISETITMVVNRLLPVGITITPSANPICGGIPVTFTATPTNGGNMPGYQWQVNGFNVGGNNPNYTYLPADGDVVSCILTSNQDCITGNPAISNTITMQIGEQPVVSFAACFDTITTINAKPIKLRGGIPLGGMYSGTGVTGGTSWTFDPFIAGPGIHQITYSYTNFALCSQQKSRTIHVLPSSLMACGSWLLDIRDSSVYPTVQIGSQCWMAANLDYGSEIPHTVPQRDNCIPEKYSRPSSLVPRPSYYQWDELMCYSDVQEIQGFCPPGWHVPSEADFNTLFANWTNNAFAGAPLKYSGYSGFNALMAGAEFFNKGWEYDGFATFFWSSSSHGPWKAWAHVIDDYDHSVSYYPSYRANAFSVRCILD